MAARHTILVVDDEPDVVKSVQDLLRFDYRVLGATRAADGMRILASDEVHVVMTDQRMPETTGVEFLTKVRGEHPEAVRLLFTGYADIRAVIDAINQGNVYRYITKPWDPDELQTVIREAVQRFDLLVERKKLLSILQQQNRDLEKANAELIRANELKHAFIQVASHELRTPLTILTGLTRLASRLPAAQGSGAGPLGDFLGRIEQAGRRLQHLVDQLVSMLTANQFERVLDRQPIDLAELLRQAADDVRPFVELRKQTLALDVADDLGTFDVDAHKVRDSVNHLLLNAIKFTPDGGTVTLRASRAGGDGAAEVRVTDTGPGIDPDQRQRVFEPFFTGFDVSHHSSGQFEHNRKGLGLGLSLVRKFIEMHGGTVQVEGETGPGATFVIKLPAHAAPAEPAATPAVASRR